MYRKIVFALALALLLSLPFAASAQKRPVMGIWQGGFTDSDWKSTFVEARVSMLSDRSFRAVFYIGKSLDDSTRVEVRGKGESDPKDGIANFDGQVELAGQGGTFKVIGHIGGEKFNGKFVQGRKEHLFRLNRVFLKSPTLGKNPPTGAIVLMDGKSMDAWNVRPRWVLDGAGSAHIQGSSIVSNAEFGDAEYHVEFRCPLMASDRGQARGNSGVYVHGRYEVQVLDSFGDVPKDNLCGGIYQQAVPAAIAALPPEEWQTYDITFRAARFDSSGKKTENANITVVHNGITIHNGLSLTDLTGGSIGSEEVARGPLMLQDHSDQVRYRNVWVKPIN